MEDAGFFFQAFVYLAAAVVAVPVAKRLGLGSVLGYLAAGIAIGPFVLGLVGQEGQDVMHFAEFGVVIMLFLIGLELEPALLWRLRVPILGLGGLQLLGRRAYESERAAQKFRREDDALVRELAGRRGDADFVALARARLAETELLLEAEHKNVPGNNDAAWDAGSIIREFAPADPNFKPADASLVEGRPPPRPEE